MTSRETSWFASLSAQLRWVALMVLTSPLAFAVEPGMLDHAEKALSLDAAVDRALEGNPGLGEIRARAEALAAIPSQVGAPPDPMIAFGAANLPIDSFDLNQEPMTQLQFGVSQTFPFPGKLRLKEQIAALNADAANQDVEELVLDLVADVRSTWWQLAYLAEAGKIVAQNQDLMREFIEIARTKYEVGRGLQQDVLLAQLELSKLLDLSIQIEGNQANAYARLNALLDWPPTRRPPLPSAILTALPELLPEAGLFEIAATTRPRLIALQIKRDAADTGIALARRNYYPDLDVSAGYGLRNGENAGGGARADFASIRLNVSVPIFLDRKQARAVDQKRAEFIASNYALSDAQARVRGEVAAAIADYTRARRSVELFREGIIPQAQQTVASMLAAYQVNKVDFLNLVGAEITLYNYEMQYWQAVAKARQALAQLAAAVGTEDIVSE